MSTFIDVDYSQLDNVMELIQKSNNSENIINEILHGEGATVFKDSIKSLLPVSGRKWKGKKTAASRTMPFTQEDGNLSITIKSKPSYNYLYFPDDGSNTQHHGPGNGGGQHFMLRGVEQKTDYVVDKITQQLIKEIGGQ